MTATQICNNCGRFVDVDTIPDTGLCPLCGIAFWPPAVAPSSKEEEPNEHETTAR